jgi:hypothetical protein
MSLWASLHSHSCSSRYIAAESCRLLPSLFIKRTKPGERADIRLTATGKSRESLVRASSGRHSRLQQPDHSSGRADSFDPIPASNDSDLGRHTRMHYRQRRISFQIERNNEENEMSIWTILFVVLLIAWLGGLTVFHVAGGLIHLLLVFAVISLILHFVMGTRTA